MITSVYLFSSGSPLRSNKKSKLLPSASMKISSENGLNLAIEDKATVDTAPFDEEKLNLLLNESRVDHYHSKEKRRHHLQRPESVEHTAWRNIRRSLARSSLSRNDLIYIVDFLIVTQQSDSNPRSKRFRPLPQGIWSWFEINFFVKYVKFNIGFSKISYLYCPSP